MNPCQVGDDVGEEGGAISVDNLEGPLVDRRRTRVLGGIGNCMSTEAVLDCLG